MVFLVHKKKYIDQIKSRLYEYVTQSNNSAAQEHAREQCMRKSDFIWSDYQ